VYTYRKLHLFDREKLLFLPGDRSPEVQYIKGVKIGIMICFDWIFPETMRVLSLSGAQIICHPSNLVLSYCQQAMLTRCLENNVFAITANRFGTERRPHGSLRFTGKSQIVAPRGILLHRACSQKEQLTVIEIDPQLARNKKITNHNDLFKDRRNELYGIICSKKRF
jgi:predicted amidohydrolase